MKPILSYILLNRLYVVFAITDEFYQEIVSLKSAAGLPNYIQRSVVYIITTEIDSSRSCSYHTENYAAAGPYSDFFDVFNKSI